MRDLLDLGSGDCVQFSVSIDLLSELTDRPTSRQSHLLSQLLLSIHMSLFFKDARHYSLNNYSANSNSVSTKQLQFTFSVSGMQVSMMKGQEKTTERVKQH